MLNLGLNNSDIGIALNAILKEDLKTFPDVSSKAYLTSKTFYMRP